MLIQFIRVVGAKEAGKYHSTVAVSNQIFASRDTFGTDYSSILKAASCIDIAVPFSHSYALDTTIDILNPRVNPLDASISDINSLKYNINPESRPPIRIRIRAQEIIK
jgi:hypothetical protein